MKKSNADPRVTDKATADTPNQLIALIIVSSIGLLYSWISSENSMSIKVVGSNKTMRVNNIKTVSKIASK